MSLQLNFEMMANYNQWINKNFYEAASKLNADELLEDRGAFFGSILETLNHLFVGDIIWLQRFARHPSQLKSLDYVRGMETPKALNVVLYPVLENLTDARARMDSTIQEFSHELSDDILLSSLSYRNTKGELFTKNMGYLIQHFFNHQTHHRGQVSTLLSQAGIDIGVTDLLDSIPDDLKANAMLF